MTYDAAVGKPIPSMRQAIIVRTNAIDKLFPEKEMIKLANFRPTPVKFKIPIMMPAVAHAEIIPIADVELFTSAPKIFTGVINVLFEKKETSSTVKIAHKAALFGLDFRIVSMKINTNNGAIKKPCFLKILIGLGILFLSNPCRPVLAASKSTII
jgi:hypothetical protein